MDIISKARELGKLIQEEQAYKNLETAKQNSDKDQELQNLIGDFNLKRMAINNEAAKTDRNDEKMQELNAEMRHSYAKIMKNENMTAYNDAKTKFDTLIQRVMAIVQNSADGQDPETTDYTESCGGSCGTCGGCH